MTPVKTISRYDATVAAINVGTFDADLDGLLRAVQTRITELRKTRTIHDYPIGSTVVFNDYCGTKYLRGHRATVVSRGRAKMTVVLERPVGRFVRVENGVARPVEIKVPPSIVDLVS